MSLSHHTMSNLCDSMHQPGSGSIVYLAAVSQEAR